MSFDPKAFLESVCGNGKDAPLAEVVDVGHDVFTARFGPRFSSGDTGDGYDLVVEWHDHTGVLSFSIFLDYREFGIKELEEGIMLVDRMNGRAEQLVRFCNYYDHDEKQHMICARAGLIIFEEEGSAWRILERRFCRTLAHLISESEWHTRHSGKPSTRVVQNH